jgi:hypothetical protein
MIYHDADQEYLNHDGTKVILGNRSILIQPSTQNPLNLPYYEQFKIELLVDEIDQNIQYLLNTTPIDFVDQARFNMGCHCAYLDESNRRIIFQLPNHLGQEQRIDW